MTYPFRALPNLQCETLINDEWRKTGQLRHDQVYELLGVKGNGRLPDEGFSWRTIVNVRLWCVPKIKGVAQDAARIWCECPDCHKVLTFGKLQQHRKVHKL